jgi:hypothetical protein
MAFVPVLSGTPAHAAIGSWYYDNKNPSTTGCNNDAYTVDTVTDPRGARLLLRYSPSCRTVWAHISGAAKRDANYAGGYATIHRNNDNVSLHCHADPGATGCFTNMLYDGGMTSHATGNDDGFYSYVLGPTINW